MEGTMTVVTVHEAKMHLSQLIERACAGEEILIARGKEPVIRLAPLVDKRPRRQFGAMKDQIKFNDAFFEPLPEDELAPWER
jgi:antitoxin (DNA-binding transcriptional repressor) of toxin-antitoxin stability system